MTRAAGSDPEFLALAAIATALQSEYAGAGKDWEGSPFAWIMSRPSRQRGAIGEQLVAAWLTARGFDVQRSPDSDADRLVNGHRVEIKFSTLWTSGIYKFQQLRNQDYAFVICLGISPFGSHCWAIPKAELRKRWQQSVSTGKAVEGVMPQHGGASGRDTAWMTVKPSAPLPWLAAYGGRLAEAASYLGKAVRRP